MLILVSVLLGACLLLFVTITGGGAAHQATSQVAVPPPPSSTVLTPKPQEPYLIEAKDTQGFLTAANRIPDIGSCRNFLTGKPAVEVDGRMLRDNFLSTQYYFQPGHEAFETEPGRFSFLMANTVEDQIVVFDSFLHPDHVRTQMLDGTVQFKNMVPIFEGAFGLVPGISLDQLGAVMHTHEFAHKQNAVAADGNATPVALALSMCVTHRTIANCYPELIGHEHRETLVTRDEPRCQRCHARTSS